MTQNSETVKSFISPSTGEPCDSAQYIAELMCQRKAERNGNSLAYKFWNKTQKDDYKGQIVSARKLVKKFGEKPILAYLRGYGKNVYSLGHFAPLKFVVEGIAFEKSKIDNQIPSEELEVKEPVNITVPKQYSSGGGLLSKIKKAEKNNGEEKR